MYGYGGFGGFGGCGGGYGGGFDLNIQKEI
jgi:hypothetical protein